MRIAVVGVGSLGQHHARILSALPEARLVAVVDRDASRAEAIAARHGVPALTDHRRLPPDLEAVTIAVPTSEHANVASDCLGRGLDVLVEKPMAATVAEAASLVAAAEAAGRMLLVGHTERFNPVVRAATERVRDARFIEAHRLGVFSDRSTDVDVVLDLMIHDLDIALTLVKSEIAAVDAVGVAALTGKTDIANARLEFEGGCVATLTASRVSAERTRKLRVFGPRLYCSVDMHARTVRALRLADGRPELVSVDVPVGTDDPLARGLSDFAGAVRERRDPLVSGEVGRDALVLAHRVLAAIERHRQESGGARA